MNIVIFMVHYVAVQCTCETNARRNYKRLNQLCDKVIIHLHKQDLQVQCQTTMNHCQ